MLNVDFYPGQLSSSWFLCGAVDVHGCRTTRRLNFKQRAAKPIFLQSTLYEPQPSLIQRVKKGLEPPGELLNPTIWSRLVLSLLLCPIFQMWHRTMTPKPTLSPPRLIPAPGWNIKRWVNARRPDPELNQVQE